VILASNFTALSLPAGIVRNHFLKEDNVMEDDLIFAQNAAFCLDFSVVVRI
jgi:hypothetical protein